MGSPVSVVVAEIVIPLWLRYVDDTFTAVHKDEIDDFHDHLNEQTPTSSLLKRSKKMENFLF